MRTVSLSAASRCAWTVTSGSSLTARGRLWAEARAQRAAIRKREIWRRKKQIQIVGLFSQREKEENLTTLKKEDFILLLAMVVILLL